MSTEMTPNEEYEFLRSRIAEIYMTIDNDQRQLKYLLEDLAYLEEELLRIESQKSLRTANRRIKRYLKVDPTVQLKRIIGKS